MASNLQMPKLVIPSGFEGRAQAIEQRRALAKALRDRALEGTSPNAQSWTQVLAPIVQGLAGGYVESRADKEQKNYDKDLIGAFQNTQTGIMADAAKVQSGEMPLETLVGKYQNNPLAQQMIEPYIKAFGTLMANRQSWGPTVISSPGGTLEDALINKAGEVKSAPFHIPKTQFVNQTAVDMNTVRPGQAAPDDPNAVAWSGGRLNASKILGNIMSQGLPIDNPQALVAAIQSMGGQQPSMQAPQMPAPPQAGLPPLTDDPASVSAYSAAIRARNPQRPPDATYEGKPVWQINGKWYDNPEGQ